MIGMPTAAHRLMASRLTKETRPRHPVPNPTSEWEIHPPLPPREVDPSGEGEALRTHAHPGDDTVFAANAEKAKKDDVSADVSTREPRATENDAERSRTER